MREWGMVSFITQKEVFMRIEPTSPVIMLQKYETRRVMPSFGAVLADVHKKALQRELPLAV